TNGDYLTVQEVETALTTAGVYIDVLGFDACLMANVEIDYQLRSLAQVRVASEEVVPLDGWPYDTILGDLTTTPTMNPNSLGNTIVDRYMGYYGTGGIETKSAVDLLQENTLSAAIESLALELISKIGTYITDIRDARGACDAAYYDLTYIDLYNFSYQIYNRISDTAIQNASQNIMNTINSMTINEGHGIYHPGFHGTTIYYPGAAGDYDSSYESILDFTTDLSWDEFLLTYYANLPDDNYEENDYYTQAYNLTAYEDTWLSMIDGPGIQADDDWYEIYISPGYERLLVELTFTHIEGDIDIDVYDVSLSYITGSWSTTDNEYINYVVPSSGTYYLLIYYANLGNEYDLWWNDTLTAGPGDDNYEPNDDYTQAYDLSSYEQIWLYDLNGYGIQADVDWYEIYITSGYEHLVVDLIFSHAAGDIDIDVYDVSLTFITESSSITDNEYIDFILPSNGIYYLVIYGENAGNTYNLWWDDLISTSPTDDNYEPNDSYAQAYDLSAYENTWLSTIDGYGIQADDDWYEIYITAENLRLRVDLTFSHAAGDIDIAVYDNTLSLIAEAWSMTDNEYINTVVPSSGTYYLLIYYGDAGNEYDLRWYSQSTTDGDGPGIPGYNILILCGSILLISLILIKKLNKK
ncbi:MAG: clostripain-related cysteine peptidase, partial [Candidatus Hodarchaeota archaeon]